MGNFDKNLSVIVLSFMILVTVSLACSTILPGSDEDPTNTPPPEGGNAMGVTPGTGDSGNGVPDLLISTGHAGMVVTGNCLESYGPITTEICVKNQGDAPAGTFLVGVSEGSSWTINGLDPGETNCFESEFNFSAETITADLNNQISETNEGNNTWTVPAPTPPVLCAPTAEQAQAAPEPDIVFQGTSFSYNDILASSVTPELKPEQGEAAIEAWNAPEHLFFTFNGYPLPDSFHTPRILIFPTDEYNAINSTAGDVIYQLKQLLQNQPPDPEDIPSLPIFNAAQFMQARVYYFRFQNGSGVRFLTQYGQAAWPINSDDMFYAYQGITDDGLYYVSAVLPISHPNLPDPNSVTIDDAFYDNFMNYVDGMEDQLATELPDTFFPTLSILDDMIKSLLVNGANQ